MVLKMRKISKFSGGGYAKNEKNHGKGQLKQNC